MMAKKSEDLEYPRAILHVDGDGFFASCEVARKPELRGRPVVVGAERGIATAMTYEAKALGITRGMPIARIRKEYPEVVIFRGDYDWYADMSRKMNIILSRYTPEVEPYSIDESFADLTGYQIPRKTNYEKMAKRIKEELRRELGMTFSVGLAPTKTLAKVASKHDKPDGLVFIPMSLIPEFLRKTHIGKVWGIGEKTAAKFEEEGVSTALKLIEHSERWVHDRFSRPYSDIRTELRGETVHPVRRGLRGGQKSFMHTRTFSPATSDSKVLFAELMRHLESVMRNAREDGVAPRAVGVFLKTQAFRYRHAEIVLLSPTNIPAEVAPALREKLEVLIDERTLYRATGVVIHDLIPGDGVSSDLFDTARIHDRFTHIYQKIDALNQKFGRTMVRLAGSGAEGKKGTKATSGANPPKKKVVRKFTKGMPFVQR
jgi:DNA polymerase-4/DNA polymerase V